MKHLVITILLCFFYNIVSCQLYDNPPLAIKDIEKGLTNIDSFRTVLLENGFKFNKNDSVGEFWDVSKTNDDSMWLVYIQIFTAKCDDVPCNKFINITVNKKNLPQYASKLLNNIKQTFPEKEAQQVTVSRDNETKMDYQLYYYRKGSDIGVTVTEDEYRQEFCFEKNFK